MPTEAVANSQLPLASTHDPATRRSYRLALGTALALLVSQVAGWSFAFVAPVLAALVLSTPLPPLGLKKSIGLLIVLVGPILLFGLGLLPAFQQVRAIGILLASLLLFHSFYFTARGGNPVLGNMMTIGLTLVVTVGSVSSLALVEIAKGLAISVVAATLCIAFAHALLPDRPSPEPAPSPPAPPPKAPQAPVEADAIRKAIRALVIVLPLALLFLAAPASPTYTVIMIKVATMAQQATVSDSEALGTSLFQSTFYGGLAAVAGWLLLAIWPSLLVFTLVVFLAGLVFSRWIFAGPGMHPAFQTANYALATMIIILAPAALDQVTGTAAGMAFWNRLLLFAFIGVYGAGAVRVYDAFWPKR